MIRFLKISKSNQIFDTTVFPDSEPNSWQIFSLKKAIFQRCSIKSVFLEIPQNSQENACVRVSFLIKLQASLLKKKLWHRCFLVNFAKFLRTPFFIERLWWLVMSIAPVIANAALHCKHLDPWWNDVLYAWS